ncbi:LacI family DNA-binding transcriptional regulator [Gracilibacillus alcaliphilus]|uniref:LacI family DNA-binding transcriptional regulator n=1 Tax=Gracilibacillus alcaliphilus TaxID=1401441 RepID=UPI00195A305C|nr:LacI family DNA-binding transcriptional regulator [Gracilibacillus alcaliphilus]MBM7677565.1 DNA-binding LacI/PurR family transcriptional regulator [Gracilibacillus alcaliphilus]
MDKSTIIDVAKLANTSKSTVSRYLNGYKVKKETKEALDRAIRELNYHPNANARRLVKNNTQVIGIVVDDIANIFYADILRGIESVLNSYGYRCAYYSRTSNYQGEFGFMDLANEGEVDGLILVSFLKRSQEMLDEVKKLAIPIVLIGDADYDSGVFSVDVNNELGISELVHYLYRIGHRNIAYINGPEHFSASYWRKKGYENTLKELGLSYKESWIIDSDWTKAGGHKAMSELLAFKDITAVVSSNDEMAIGALLYASELGFHVPRDLSIVGFDDTEVSKWVYPPLTTVKQPLHPMGEKAATGLIAKLKGEQDIQEQRILIDPKLVVRQSCRNL